MPIVRFEGSDQSMEVGKGANLRRSLLLHGHNPHRSLTRSLNCHGLGLCGTCWVEVLEGEENLSPPTKMESLPTSPFKRLGLKGRRLSCQVRVYGDCLIRIASD
ncbi:MAG: (2Fe-2S)-binding protein [Armatimonadetes bacterium]|nr:(2Fe-2S)-binding protein [Armatimonadota bacterium]